MGADKNEARNHRYARLVEKTANRKAGVDYESENADVVLKAIATVALSGGALRFGYTRDGGAYAVGIMGDGDPYTLYAAESGEFETLLRTIIEIWTEP